ncbi:hypothetical protein HBH70_074380 [Parastagonospora nodorum]|nr:hypothetical protein HBH50_235300 [Parastagonospora nodorum]KAH4079240.1 hypothetical protein HBH48_221260 [Parastagonospora nodorum]KAH4115729.1 hypothetical protein HBH47_175850 [Parastagonospora nodorum]KAH4176529.1 hypothetical protein HBH43_060200 [Parastagonospora nodorum]KAH4220225.1 hypothetical protein HBI06_172640 [Parastagonospora nodorum]
MLKAPGWVTIMLCNNGKPSGPPSHPSHALGRVECGVIGHAQYSSAVVNQLDFMWTLKARPWAGSLDDMVENDVEVMRHRKAATEDRLMEYWLDYRS